MNHYAVQLKASTSYEEMKNSFSGSVSIISDRRVERESVFCPKPRRFPLVNSTVNDPIRPLRWYHSSHQVEPCESRVGIDLLDIILPKGGDDGDLTYSHLGSSPPYFCGSPPSRVSNPLIQDVRFGDEKFSSISPPINPVSAGSSSSSPSPRKGGCMRSNFGNNPTVRVEGFDCLDRDRRRNCSIPTLA